MESAQKGIFYPVDVWSTEHEGWTYSRMSIFVFQEDDLEPLDYFFAYFGDDEKFFRIMVDGQYYYNRDSL